MKHPKPATLSNFKLFCHGPLHRFPLRQVPLPGNYKKNMNRKDEEGKSRQAAAAEVNCPFGWQAFLNGCPTECSESNRIDSIKISDNVPSEESLDAAD